MTVATLGEDEVVRRLLEIFQATEGSSGVAVGPGDDCAVLATEGHEVWVWKCDAVAEDVHFSADTSPELVGGKALKRAVSDFAAMGGAEPKYAMLTLGINQERAWSWLQSFAQGFMLEAQRWNISVVGGETMRIPSGFWADVHLTGVGERQKIVRRSGGQPGDVLAVTGCLGGSLAGWHLHFKPRLREAQWLCQHFVPHAMMDLSDGLGSDLPRLAKASGCGFQIQDVPIREGCSWEQAIQDGEDYELLMAFAPQAWEAVKPRWDKAWPQLPLNAIGHLTEPQNQKELPRGFSHFRE